MWTPEAVTRLSSAVGRRTGGAENRRGICAVCCVYLDLLCITAQTAVTDVECCWRVLVFLFFYFQGLFDFLIALLCRTPRLCT